MNNILLLNEYIKALVLNVDKENLPSEIDISFDGGVFNGIYAYGISLYIKALEKMGLTKVKRVSGCSVGALIGLLYLSNITDGNIINVDEIFNNLVNDLKKNGNLKNYRSTLKNIVYNIFDTDELKEINDKLFINFYDLKKCKQRIVSKYKNREHLIDCLVRTSYLPYLIDGNFCYNERYIDGIIPHIFKDNIRSNLFIKIVTLKNAKRMLYFKNERNIQYRTLCGVCDANNFFTDGKSDMCSYVNKWNYKDKLTYHGREIIILFIIFIIKYILNLKKIIPKKYFKSMIIECIIRKCKELLKEIISITLST